ncbi:MAG: hypothetical protein IKN64_11790 [Desulfovibrio sp.]|nr:hypothetical protein [Desulfovibrio sp.]
MNEFFVTAFSHPDHAHIEVFVARLASADQDDGPAFRIECKQKSIRFSLPLEAKFLEI